MTAPDHMSETLKNCLHETGHPHMGPPANSGRFKRMVTVGEIPENVALRAA